MGQRPAAEHRTDRHPVRKSLFLGEVDRGFSTFLGGMPLTAELMEYGNHTPGKTQAKGVGNLLCQRHRLLALRQPLVRRAQVPQFPGSMAMANDPGILPIEDSRGAVLLGVV